MTVDLPPINFVALAGGLLVIAGALGLLWRPIRRAWRRLDDFFADWNGQPSRPGHDKVDGMMEWRAQVTADVAEIKAWAGNGINSKVEALAAQTGENHAAIVEHIESADRTRLDLVDRIESLAEDVAESRDAAADAARLAGDTAVVAARELQKISGRMDDFDEKVTERLFTLEESERTLRAIVHEVGFDVDIPTPPDAA
jgi:hypothetical protein